MRTPRSTGTPWTTTRPATPPITRWGILQGPGEAFAPRTRYYGFQQILPYVQAGSTILPIELDGPERLAALAIGGGERRPSDLTIAAINRSGPTQLTLTLDGPAPDRPSRCTSRTVTVTSSTAGPRGGRTAARPS